MSALTLLLTLLFPRRCVVCGKFGRYLCHKCQIKIKPPEFQVCPVCERPAIGGATHPKCQTRYGLDGLTSFFVYDGPIKKAIKELKYRLVTDLAEELISVVEHAEVGTKILCGTKNMPFRSWQNFVPPRMLNCVLIPVPLHSSRFRWRGFNQAEILGKIISARVGANFLPDLLVRKKFTQPQAELKGDERKENIIDAFAVSSKVYQLPSKILLFDDVWTTGSTLRTAGKVLKRAGVKKVWGMTLAR